MKIKFTASACAMLTCVLVATLSYAQESHVHFNELPSAVQQTARQQSRGAAVRGYTRDYENGHMEYEVETIRNGMTRDVAIDSAGHVLEVEQQVPMSEVPPAAREAIRKGAAGGHVLRVEKVSSPGSSEVAYEAGIRVHGHYREVRVHANGSPAPETDAD